MGSRGTGSGRGQASSGPVTSRPRVRTTPGSGSRPSVTRETPTCFLVSRPDSRRKGVDVPHRGVGRRSFHSRGSVPSTLRVSWDRLSPTTTTLARVHRLSRPATAPGVSRERTTGPEWATTGRRYSGVSSMTLKGVRMRVPVCVLVRTPDV